MRDAGPEIDRAGKHGPFGGIVDLRQDQHQRREDHEVLDRVVVREHQPGRPFGMRLVVARRIGHRAAEAADLTAVEDVGHPQQSRQNHRQRQPEQFARHRFPLSQFRIPSRRDDLIILKRACDCATRGPGRSCRARPRSAARLPVPTRARRNLLGVDAFQPFAPVRPPRSLVLLRALEPVGERDVLDIVVGPVLVFARRRRIDHAGDMAGARQHVFHRPAEELRAVQHRFRRRDVILAGRQIVDRHLDLRQIEQRVVQHHAAGGQPVLQIAVAQVIGMVRRRHPRRVRIPVQQVERRGRLVPSDSC